MKDRQEIAKTTLNSALFSTSDRIQTTDRDIHVLDGLIYQPIPQFWIVHFKYTKRSTLANFHIKMLKKNSTRHHSYVTNPYTIT